MCLSMDTMSLVGYEDSESESDNENTKEKLSQLKYSSESSQEMRKRRKLTAPPVKLVHKFSKTPLRVNVKTTKKGDSVKTLETTFVYLPITPTVSFISEVDNLITDLLTETPTTSCSIENLCINKLTKTVATLHISLSYNLTSSRNELDKFIEKLRTYIREEMEFPINIGFSKNVETFSNEGNSKVFIALKLDEGSIDKLRPLVAQINSLSVKQPQYDADALHVSVATVAGATHVANVRTAVKPGLRVAVQRVELSRGRSVAVLSGKSGER